ncbi:MAG: FkbM family methyltransferase [Cycloclasticus sp.]|nr:FkbM family methyltransferase [Cycloclasticus sp.]
MAAFLNKEDILRQYYSQHGEDALLDLIFGNQKEGFFVEVGCIDGRRFSNTLTFEERGWKGMCIEAHNGYIELLKKNRPNSIVCHCAAGEADEDAIFYANARGSLSTLDKTSEARWQRDYAPYFSGFEEQQVKKVRLSTLLDYYHIIEIDILSLDIEGYEAEAVKGLDFIRHRPRVMVIESDSPLHERQLDKLILPHGYTKAMKLAANLVYVRDKSLEKMLMGKKKVVQLLHTQHPLDSGGDRLMRAIVDTTLQKDSLSMFDKLRFKLTSTFRKRSSKVRQSQLLDVGFHGDEYLLGLAEHLALASKVFIETGANVGSTLAYVAKNNPMIRCLSCEPDQSAFEQASINTVKAGNVSLLNGTSQQFIEHLTRYEPEIFSEQCMFWLDAHGYGFEWPLKKELEFITGRFSSAYILIDDFKVPGRSDFIYDEYQEQICSYDYVKDALNPDKNYQLYYPTYKDKTSKHHPLCGWGLLVFGHDDFTIPKQLADKMERVL